MRLIFKIFLLLLLAYAVYYIYKTIFLGDLFAFGMFLFMIFLSVWIIDYERRSNAK